MITAQRIKQQHYKQLIHISQNAKLTNAQILFTDKLPQLLQTQTGKSPNY